MITAGAELTCERLTCERLTCDGLTCERLTCYWLTCYWLTCEGLTCEGRADLRGADLRGANLQEANLLLADLLLADLRGANLQVANLLGAKLPNFQLPPEEGDFYAWKKVENGIVLKLLIPADAKRTSSLIGRKCRASHVVPVEAFSIVDGELVPVDGKKFVGKHAINFWYTIGRKRNADKYDPDIRVECTHGIHFFMTKQEAIEW